MKRIAATILSGKARLLLACRVWDICRLSRLRRLFAAAGCVPWREGLAKQVQHFVALRSLD
jgi:hypothetical protein